MAHTHTAALSNAGVSIWLDDLSRERLSSGSLATLVKSENVVGVTTNPSIFSQAIRSGIGYAEAIAKSAALGKNARETIIDLTCADVADACDVLHDVFVRTAGRDGWVSIEVDPALADDTAGTVAAAQELHRRIAKPNVMIKIPATSAGVDAVAGVLALGISVNVTLIFSLSRYREIVNAHQTGLERARAAGKDLSTIHSVASFFVSRFDTAVKQFCIDQGMKVAIEASSPAIANARLAYEIFLQNEETVRTSVLRAAGAPPQRLLWASTGVKDPAADPTLYVQALAYPNTVNTMPAATLQAVSTSFSLPVADQLHHYREADQILNDLTNYSINYTALTAQLEETGLEQFSTAWQDLHEIVAEQLQERK